LKEKVFLRNIRNYKGKYGPLHHAALIFNAAEVEVVSFNVRSQAGLNTTKYILWNSTNSGLKICPASVIVCHLLMFSFTHFTGNIKH
jgi:hypothetical protein